jgi:putative nucleotidyltransferase with HDIG domain
MKKVIKINFIGSRKEQVVFKNKVDNIADFVDYDNAEIVVIEINNVESLKELPKTFTKPTYFYITTEDPNILRFIAEYNTKGTIYSFFNRSLILKRLNINDEHNRTGQLSQKTSISTAQIYEKADNIPPLPTIAQEILSLSNNDTVSMSKIIDKIKMDQGLTAAILRLVNSPFYGLTSEITSIERATVLLGLKTISKLSFAVSFRQFYMKNFALYNTNGIRLWMHSFNVARLCEKLSKLKFGLDKDSIYLAGLMHDVGKIILVDFLYKVATSPSDEEKQTGITHMDVGAIILKKWKVGTIIIDAVRLHHNISKNPFNLLLYYANIIERMPKIENSVIEEMAEKINIDKDTLAREIQETTSRFTQSM